MSTNDVKVSWSVYCLLVKIMHASINGKIVLKDPNSPVPDFPSDPKKWTNWALGVDFILSLDETVEITDAALRNVANALAASHKIAAAISVDSPNEDTIKSLIDSLNELNEVIKSDRRFHVALEIGSAVADEIKKKQNQT